MRVTTIACLGDLQDSGTFNFREAWWGYNWNESSTDQDWKVIEAIGEPLVADSGQGGGSVGDESIQITDAGLYVVSAWLPCKVTMPVNDTQGRVATLNRYITTSTPGVGG